MQDIILEEKNKWGHKNTGHRGCGNIARMMMIKANPQQGEGW